MAKEVQEVQAVKDPPATNEALNARITLLEGLLHTLIANGNKQQVAAKTRDEILEEKWLRMSENMQILLAKIEQDLADGPRKWLVSIPGEPMMVRKVGASDEANAEVKFRKYHGILAIVDPAKGIMVKSFARNDEDVLPGRIKDALATDIPKTAS